MTEKYYKTRQEHIDAARVIVLEITRTDNWSRMSDLDNIIWDWNYNNPDDEIFLQECDNGIALEDEFFDLVDVDAEWDAWEKSDKIG